MYGLQTPLLREGGNSTSSIMPSGRAVCCRKMLYWQPFGGADVLGGVKSILNNDDDDDCIGNTGSEKKKEINGLSPLCYLGLPSQFLVKPIVSLTVFFSSCFNWFHSCHAGLSTRRSSARAQMQGGRWRRYRRGLKENDRGIKRKKISNIFISQ